MVQKEEILKIKHSSNFGGLKVESPHKCFPKLEFWKRTVYIWSTVDYSKPRRQSHYDVYVKTGFYQWCQLSQNLVKIAYGIIKSFYQYQPLKNWQLWNSNCGTHFKIQIYGNTAYNVIIEVVFIFQWYVLKTRLKCGTLFRIRYHKIELPEIMIFQHLCLKVYNTISHV